MGIYRDCEVLFCECRLPLSLLMNNHQGLSDGYCVGATPDSNVKAGLLFLFFFFWALCSIISSVSLVSILTLYYIFNIY